MIFAKTRLTRIFGVVLLVVGRPGEDAHHTRVAEIDDKAADVVLARLRRDVLREAGYAAGEIRGRDVGFVRDLLLRKGEHAAAAPAELVGGQTGAESALGYTIRAEDDAVAGHDVHLHLADLAVRPVLGDDRAVLGGRNFRDTAQMHVGGIAHLDDAGASAEAIVEEGERRIADLADFADRQGVHDDLDGLEQVKVRLHEPECHRRRHVRENMRLHARAETIRERRQGAVLLVDRQQLDVVAASGLPRLRELGGLHLNEEIVDQLKPPLFITPWLSACVCAV